MAKILLTFGVLLAAARILGGIAHSLRQPAVVGELLAGVVLGPTVLGSLAPSLASFLQSTETSEMFLSGFMTLSAVLFMLSAGIEVDLASAWRQGKSVLGVSLPGILFPFALGFGGVWMFPRSLGLPEGTDLTVYAVFFATTLSISALPVIAKTLLDLNLYRTDLGAVIVFSAMLNDLGGWIIFAMLLGTIGIHAGNVSPVSVLAGTLVFTVGTLTVGRVVLNRFLLWIQAHSVWPGGVLTFCVVLAFFGATFTEWIGVHAVFGSFIVGAALGDSPHLRKKTRETIDQFVSSVFAPLFFAGIGFHFNFWTNLDLLLAATIFLFASVGKVVGCGVGSVLTGTKGRQALAIGFGMNSRGAMGIIISLLGLQHGIIGERAFVALVIMTMGTTLISGPAIQWLLGSRKKSRTADFVSGRAFLRSLQSQSRESAIAELCVPLGAENGLDPKMIERAVLLRESIIPTGLDHGVAVPHARLKGIKSPTISVGISPQGIDFDAGDGSLSHLIFLIVTPEEDAASQIDILADLGRLLQNEDLRESMKRAGNFTEFLALLRTGEP